MSASIEFPLDVLQKTWFLAGPTASGKTSLALRIATELDAEIIALDSMSLYRGMDIGTAKPSPAEREQVPHHLIDIIDPHEEFSLADYVAAARAICIEILARGKTPMFVGGTGLYLRGILRGVFEGPPADWDFRKRMQHESEVRGNQWLHDELRSVDPVLAAALHPNDTRRVIRGLEVLHVTGSPLSSQQQQTPLPAADRPQHVYWLSPPRKWLYDRINLRVDQMIKAGLVGEVRGLLKQFVKLSRTATQALGYREVIEYLQGDQDLAATIEVTKTRTRQFAKRQHTWFRNLEECHEVEFNEDTSGDQLAHQLCAK